MVVPSAETDFVGDFRRLTYHLPFKKYFYTGETFEDEFWIRNILFQPTALSPEPVNRKGL